MTMSNTPIAECPECHFKAYGGGRFTVDLNHYLFAGECKTCMQALRDGMQKLGKQMRCELDQRFIDAMNAATNGILLDRFSDAEQIDG